MSTRCLCFFFNDTATTEIYTLSLHDALPISRPISRPRVVCLCRIAEASCRRFVAATPVIRGVHYVTKRRSGMHTPDNGDRKSTRLNSSHLVISYAVFCLKKKKKH